MLTPETLPDRVSEDWPGSALKSIWKAAGTSRASSASSRRRRRPTGRAFERMLNYPGECGRGTGLRFAAGRGRVKEKTGNGRRVDKRFSPHSAAGLAAARSRVGHLDSVPRGLLRSVSGSL